MKIKIAALILISLLFSGCAVYAPYGGYAVAPVVPLPVFGFGWGHGGFRR